MADETTLYQLDSDGKVVAQNYVKDNGNEVYPRLGGKEVVLNQTYALGKDGSQRYPKSYTSAHLKSYSEYCLEMNGNKIYAKDSSGEDYYPRTSSGHFLVIAESDHTPVLLPHREVKLEHFDKQIDGYYKTVRYNGGFKSIGALYKQVVQQDKNPDLLKVWPAVPHHRTARAAPSAAAPSVVASAAVPSAAAAPPPVVAAAAPPPSNPPRLRIPKPAKVPAVVIPTISTNNWWLRIVYLTISLIIFSILCGVCYFFRIV